MEHWDGWKLEWQGSKGEKIEMEPSLPGSISDQIMIPFAKSLYVEKENLPVNPRELLAVLFRMKWTSYSHLLKCPTGKLAYQNGFQ